MESIALPGKIKFNPGKNDNEGTMVVEPCYPGYGITLGNSLRRVLLSSLPGAAVVGVKIEGADHEFTSLANVKEDILEIKLNIKKLRLKLHSDEIEKLELEVHGEKKVTAGDIKKNANVEIANPDLVLAEITDISGNLKFTIYVSKGRGYEVIENRESEQKEIGYIELDSLYSPVLATSVNVENVRVGKMTNWDKLNLTITTDGTITPEEAFKLAVAILLKQLNALIGERGEEEEESAAKDGEDAGEEIDVNIVEAAGEPDAEAEKTDEDGETEADGEDKPKKKRGRPKKED